MRVTRGQIKLLMLELLLREVDPDVDVDDDIESEPTTVPRHGSKWGSSPPPAPGTHGPDLGGWRNPETDSSWDTEGRGDTIDPRPESHKVFKGMSRSAAWSSVKKILGAPSEYAPEPGGGMISLALHGNTKIVKDLLDVEKQMFREVFMDELYRIKEKINPAAYAAIFADAQYMIGSARKGVSGGILGRFEVFERQINAAVRSGKSFYDAWDDLWIASPGIKFPGWNKRSVTGFGPIVINSDEGEEYIWGSQVPMGQANVYKIWINTPEFLSIIFRKAEKIAQDKRQARQGSGWAARGNLPPFKYKTGKWAERGEIMRSYREHPIVSARSISERDLTQTDYSDLKKALDEIKPEMKRLFRHEIRHNILSKITFLAPIATRLSTEKVFDVTDDRFRPGTATVISHRAAMVKDGVRPWAVDPNDVVGPSDEDRQYVIDKMKKLYPRIDDDERAINNWKRWAPYYFNRPEMSVRIMALQDFIRESEGRDVVWRDIKNLLDMNFSEAGQKYKPQSGDVQDLLWILKPLPWSGSDVRKFNDIFASAEEPDTGVRTV